MTTVGKSDLPSCALDGDALIRAKRTSRKKFEETVAHYRERGATDQQIVDAMMRSRLLVSNLGKAR